MNGKSIKVRSERHLGDVRQLPCLITGNELTVEAHHLMVIEIETGNGNRIIDQRGMGMKSGDNFAIPLDYRIHDAIHENRLGNEKEFLTRYGVLEPEAIANQLYLALHPWDQEAMVRRIFTKNWAKNRLDPYILRIIRQ